MYLIKLFMLLFLGVSIYANNLLKQLDCDVVKEFPAYTSCYNYRIGGPLLVTYTLHGYSVNAVNIKGRPTWKIIDGLVTPSCYKINKNGYQVGHLAPDASFDYNEDVLKSVYVLGYNTVPMGNYFNMYIWSKLERYGRKLAVMHGSVTVTNVITYNKNGPMIGLTSVGDYIYKIFEYNGNTECYRGYNNVVSIYKPIKISDMRVDCSDIVFGTTYTINKIDWR